jgi:hypothetical protein
MHQPRAGDAERAAGAAAGAGAPPSGTPAAIGCPGFCGGCRAPCRPARSCRGSTQARREAGGDRPLTWAPGGRAGTALVVLCEPDGAPPVATTVPAVADQPQASGRQDAVQHEPSPRPRKKKRRPKGPARIAKERSRMQAYLESAKFVEHQCQALVAANAAAAAAAREDEEGGGDGRWVESGSGSRIVSCDTVPAPECRCTVDCVADATSRNPYFSTHPGDPRRIGTPMGCGGGCPGSSVLSKVSATTHRASTGRAGGASAEIVRLDRSALNSADSTRRARPSGP